MYIMKSHSSTPWGYLCFWRGEGVLLDISERISPVSDTSFVLRFQSVVVRIPKIVKLVIKQKFTNPHCLKMKLWLSNKNTRHRYRQSMILFSSSGNCLITDFASCFSAGCFPQTVGTLKADCPCMAARDTPETGANSHFWDDLMIHDS